MHARRLLTSLAALVASSALVPTFAQNATVEQGNTLTVVNSATPGTALSTVTAQLPAGETLAAITTDPVLPRAVIGISNAGNLYLISPSSGAVRPLGLQGSATSIGPILASQVSVIRVSASSNPVDGSVAVQGLSSPAIAGVPGVAGAGVNVLPQPGYVAGDPGVGTTPALGAIAYSNQGRTAAGSTTLYGIEVSHNTLVIIGGPPQGAGSIAVQTVGATGVPTVPTAAALAIAPSGTAYAVLTPVGTTTSGLYSVSLATGQATLIGALPAGAAYNGLALTLPSLASYGLTSNSAAVGGILDTLTLSNSARAQALIASVDAQTTADGQNAQLLALSPAAFQGLTQMTLQSLHFQDVTVRRYLRDVRQGGTEAGEQAVTYGSDRHYGMWFTGSGRTGFIKAGADRYRQSYGDYAFTGGLDYRFARGTLLGLFGGYDEGQTRLTPLAPQSDAKTWFAGGYGSATVGPVYIDVQGTYGRTHFNTRRVVADGFGGGFQYSSANGREPQSEQYQGAATAGISQDFRGVELEPYVGAKYAHITQRSFSEGTDAGALSLDRLTTVSIESIAGLRLGIKVPLTSTAVLRPTIRGEYRHEFRDAAGARDLNGTFSDGEGGLIPITFRTTPLPRDYAAVGAGFTISGNSPFSIVLDYNGEFGGQRRINGITGGFHLAF